MWAALVGLAVRSLLGTMPTTMIRTRLWANVGKLRSAMDDVGGDDEYADRFVVMIMVMMV